MRVFFVISGFLITTLLKEEYERTGSVSLRNFYVRRVFRIFPAAYAFIGIMLILNVAGLIDVPPSDWIHAVTYTVNFHAARTWNLGHLWSLSVEEQFYVLWPAIILMLGMRRGASAALMAVLVAPLIRTLSWISLPQYRSLMDEAFPMVMDAIAIGCLLAIGRDFLTASSRYLAALHSRAFVVVPVAMVLINRLQPWPSIWLPIGQSIVNLLIAIGIDWCLRFPSGRVGSFLNWKPVAFIGVLSYSLYLWQQLFLNRHSMSTIASFPINIFLLSMAAVASYYVIELPFLALRRMSDKAHSLVMTSATAPTISG